MVPVEVIVKFESEEALLDARVKRLTGSNHLKFVDAVTVVFSPLCALEH
jgi:hypothetical protein